MTDSPARDPRQLLAMGREALCFVDDPLREARMLLAHASGVPLHRIPLLARDDISEEISALYQGFVARRSAREPMSHILGYRDFYNHRFRVTPDVLDPRPETETLVEAALAVRFHRLLDLGTGSGAIAISLLAARPAAHGVATDVSQAACSIARENAQALGVADRLKVRQGNWFAGLRGPFDLIVSNPPYIAAAEMPTLAPEVRLWEPSLALTDGHDGLSAYRILAREAPLHLAAGGHLMVEIGATQGSAVLDIFQAAGLDTVSLQSDLSGGARVVSAQCL